MIRRKNSQIAAVLSHLRKYKTITSLEAFNTYGVSRLSGIIFILKQRECEIASERFKSKNRYGNVSNPVIYTLSRDVEEGGD